MRCIHPSTTQRRADLAHAAEANKRNAVSVAYFYYPEATPAQWDRTNCDACKRLAIKDALEDD